MTRRALPALRGVVATAVLVLTAACGTTVSGPVGSQAASQAGSGADLHAAGSGSTGGIAGPGQPPVAGGGAVGSTGAGAAAGSAGGAVAGGGGTAAAGGAAGGGTTVQQVGPGVTSTAVNVGVTVTDNSKAAASALGASGSGVGGGDAEAQWRIIFNDVNHRGGVLGHRLNPVFYHYDATSTASVDQQESAACAHWTQDTKIFAAAVGEGSQSNTLIRCLDRAHVVHVYDGFTTADLSTYQQFPHYVEVGSLDADRMADVWPAQLKAQGYFGGWDYNTGKPSAVTPVKIGIISFDDAASTGAVQRYLVPRLRALGYTDVEYRRVLYPSGEADNGTAIQQIQNTVLDFRSHNVSHVLPVESQGAGVGGFFARGASSQHYYPRIGLTSGNGAQVLVGAGVWPKDELNGAVGYGWVPLADVPYSADPTNGPYSNPARQRCVALMKAHGIAVSDAITERQVSEQCDQIDFLVRALQLGGALNDAAFLSGVSAMRSGFVAADTFSTFFSAARHDGVATGRPLAYTPSCGCIRYTGSPFRIP